MVPADYSNFFTTMAAVGATLFGLIFVAVSIAPESVAAASAPLDRQIKATAAYVALLNPLMISLFALVPHQQIGIVVITLGWIGLINTLAMTLTLLHNADQRSPRFRGSLFILASFFLYGFEIYVADHLLRSPADISWFYALADLMIFLSAFGIIRAWELIGTRQFLVKGWLTSFITKKKEERDPTPDRTNSASGIKKGEG
jgi:hypothetical protein